MRSYMLSVFDGYCVRYRPISADNYHDACWKAGVAGYPPGYIWSIDPVQ